MESNVLLKNIYAANKRNKNVSEFISNNED